MTDKEYHERCADLFAALEALFEDAGMDVDNTGEAVQATNDEGETILVNKQTPKWEVWLAARSGGRHFRHVDGDWRDTRDGESLMTAARALAAAAQ